MNALKRARTIWSKTAHHSKEAAHAAGVLENILSKIDRPDTDPKSARPLPNDAAATGHVTTSADPGPARIDENTPQATRHREASLAQASLPAVNTGPFPEKAPSKSYSVEWDYEWLDNLGKRKDRDISNALDNASTDGVDWVSYRFDYCQPAWSRRRDLFGLVIILHS